MELGSSQLNLLEKLCNAVAVSGDEGEVRAIVLEEVRPHAEEVRVDALGNVLVTRPGNGKDRLKVMLAAHMDEVGFMLVAGDGEGLFRFETIGAIDVRQLVGKAVCAGREHIPGVIGARPVHLTAAEEAQKKIPLEDLRIDVGPGGAKVNVGDRATFATVFRRLGPSILARALDDRLGVAALIELVKHAPPNVDLLAAFTVQEEVGLRGAMTSAYQINPDVAVALDVSHADQPNASEINAVPLNEGMGIAMGPNIHPLVHQKLAEVAKANEIPFKVTAYAGATGTDAWAIQVVREGIPTGLIDIPLRYMHTSVETANIKDIDRAGRWLAEAIARLSDTTLQEFAFDTPSAKEAK